MNTKNEEEKTYSNNILGWITRIKIYWYPIFRKWNEKKTNDKNNWKIVIDNNRLNKKFLYRKLIN